jgi:regulation of enolase protein 1 (concanavalin A-like superfamily)
MVAAHAVAVRAVPRIDDPTAALDRLDRVALSEELDSFGCAQTRIRRRRTYPRLHSRNAICVHGSRRRAAPVARRAPTGEPATMHTVSWSAADWLTPPASAVEDGKDLVVTTRTGSDFWRTTSYGFVHDDGHALLTPMPDPGAVEVTFSAGLPDLYDQAGLLLRVDAETWLKAGVERTDGAWHLGAVVTLGASDWSLAPVPEWQGRDVTVRASRAGDAVTIRARVASEPWRTVRLAPFPAGVPVLAGPMCCSPQGPGAQVRFTRFVMGPADADLHLAPA